MSKKYKKPGHRGNWGDPNERMEWPEEYFELSITKTISIGSSLSNGAFAPLFGTKGRSHTKNQNKTAKARILKERDESNG